MCKYKPDHRSQETFGLLMKLSESSTFNEDTGGMNETFDKARKEVASSEKIIAAANKIISKQEAIKAKAEAIIRGINGN